MGSGYFPEPIYQYHNRATMKLRDISIFKLSIITIITIIIIIAFITIPLYFGSPTSFSTNLFSNDNFIDVKYDDPVYTITDSLFAPSDITVIDDDIFVLDFKDNRPLKRYNIETGDFIEYFSSYGKGPNELTKNGPKRFSATETELLVMDSDLTFSRLPIDSIFGSYSKIALPQRYFDFSYDDISDIVIFRGGMSQTNNLLYIYRYNLDKFVLLDSIITLGDHKQLKAILSNPLVNQGPFLFDHTSNTVFIGFHYSTLIESINIVHRTIVECTEPNFVPLPNGKAKGTYFESPDATKNMDTYIDFATDSTYLYAIYSGIRWKTRDFIQGNAKLGSGKILRIFTKDKLRYVGSIEMPLWAKLLVVTNNKVLIYAETPLPQIVLYNKKKVVS